MRYHSAACDPSPVAFDRSAGGADRSAYGVGAEEGCVRDRADDTSSCERIRKVLLYCPRKHTRWSKSTGHDREPC